MSKEQQHKEDRDDKRREAKTDVKRDVNGIDVTEGQYRGYTPLQAKMIEDARGEPPGAGKHGKVAKPGAHGGLPKDAADEDTTTPSLNEPPGSTVWDDLPEYVPPVTQGTATGRKEMPVSKHDAASDRRERDDDRKHK